VHKGDKMKKKIIYGKGLLKRFEELQLDTNTKRSLFLNYLKLLGIPKYEKMLKKVYCVNCKFAKFWEDSMRGCGYDCKHPSNIEKYDTPIQPQTRFIFALEVINKNNDCSNYQRKWWKFGKEK